MSGAIPSFRGAGVEVRYLLMQQLLVVPRAMKSKFKYRQGRFKKQQGLEEVVVVVVVHRMRMLSM